MSRKSAFTEEQQVKICEEYIAGATLTALADKYGTSDNPIRTVLKNHNIKRTDSVRQKRWKISLEQRKLIAEKYQAGETAQSLAIQYKVTDPTIKAILLDLGIEVRSVSVASGGLTPEQKLQVKDLYSKGKTIKDIAGIFDMAQVTISSYLGEYGIDIRPGGFPGLSKEQEDEAVNRYIQGENSVEIAKSLGFTNSCILKVVRARGTATRTRSEAKILEAEKDLDVDEIIKRYQSGESSISIAEDYEVTGQGLIYLLRRHNIEIRERGPGDSVVNMIEGTGNFTKPRETYYYIFTINGYDNLLKPGITHDIKGRIRSSQGIYNEQLLHEVFSTREEAFCLEQAILKETRKYAYAPLELIQRNWQGTTELLDISYEVLVDFINYYKNELEELGVWQFASTYVPMTEPEKNMCREKSLLG